MPTNLSERVNDIVEFALQHTDYYAEEDRSLMRRYVRQHIKYGTMVTLMDKSELIAVLRFNWTGPITIHVIDVIIRPDYRKLSTLKLLGTLLKMRCPQIQYFWYDRYKYPERGSKGYSAAEWLKLRRSK